MKRRMFLCAALAAAAVPPAARAAVPGFRFPSIDGGTIDLADWRGRPVLVVNTASLCGFAPQFEGLQRLYDRYRGRGLVVFAVPSDDFNQELASGAEVKSFCELTWGIDMPMAEITPVRGAQAHPFFRWLAEAHGFVPSWNFNKVLLAPDGQPAGFWGSTTRPESRPILAAIEPFLAD